MMSTRNTAKLCSLTVERIYKTNIAKKMGKQKRRSRSRREEEFPWSICVWNKNKTPFIVCEKGIEEKKVAVKWKQNFTASVLFASSPLSDSWEMSTLSIAAKLRQHFPHELTHADVCLLAVCTCVVMEAVTLSPPSPTATGTMYVCPYTPMLQCIRHHHPHSGTNIAAVLQLSDSMVFSENKLGLTIVGLFKIRLANTTHTYTLTYTHRLRIALCVCTSRK